MMNDNEYYGEVWALLCHIQRRKCTFYCHHFDLIWVSFVFLQLAILSVLSFCY